MANTAAAQLGYRRNAQQHSVAILGNAQQHSVAILGNAQQYSTAILSRAQCCSAMLSSLKSGETSRFMDRDSEAYRGQKKIVIFISRNEYIK